MKLMLLQTLMLYFANLSQCFTHTIPTNILYNRRRSPKELLCRYDGEVEWPELDVDYDKYKLYNDLYNISYKFENNQLYKINKIPRKNLIRKGNND